MSPLSISLVVFACAFGAALLGLLVQHVLPDHHVSSGSKEIVRLGMGMVATMMALVLGLLVASAKSFYDAQTAEVTQLATNIVLLDRLLAHYGNEATEARTVLRSSVAQQMELMWPKVGFAKAAYLPGAGGGEIIIEKIYALSPGSEKQRVLQSQALSLAVQTGQTRWLMFEQAHVPFPKVFLVMLIFWMITLFLSFGLFAPSNFTVLASLFIAALAVCGSILLILEMYQPYSGLIRIADAPLRAALAQLGQ